MNQSLPNREKIINPIELLTNVLGCKELTNQRKTLFFSKANTVNNPFFFEKLLRFPLNCRPCGNHEFNFYFSY